MKSIIKVAALLVMASLGQGSPQGGGVQYVDPGPTPLRLWLYWDDNGEKYYPASGKPGMTLNGKCHKNMIDYDGVWVDKDPRDVRQTCVKVYEDDACEGNWDPIKIETSTTDHTEVAFKDVNLHFPGKSFIFDTDGECNVVGRPF